MLTDANDIQHTNACNAERSLLAVIVATFRTTTQSFLLNFYSITISSINLKLESSNFKLSTRLFKSTHHKTYPKMHQTILITGASSGLGLAFLRHYDSLPFTSIIAIDIHPLPCLPPEYELTGLQFFQIDITSESDLHSLAAKFNDQPISLLIHCAGIRGLNQHTIDEQRANGSAADVAAAETFKVMDKDTMLRTFEINTFGTFNTISAFLPSLLLAPNAKCIVLSSRMGSVSSNTTGGGYAYRASKAALNAVVKSFSIDVPEVTFLLLHPGRVETGLVGWKEEGAISVEESVRDCLKCMESVGEGANGKMVDRFGVEIAW
jgi:NAD(P)-dependent dehydrogenase (short-subunit alcohol dehydrogenase family)